MIDDRDTFFAQSPYPVRVGEQRTFAFAVPSGASSPVTTVEAETAPNVWAVQADMVSGSDAISGTTYTTKTISGFVVGTAYRMICQYDHGGNRERLALILQVVP